jgi:hypothetical protein
MTSQAATNPYDRYLALTLWAAARYRDREGVLVLSCDGALSTYSRIEMAAAKRYLGCTNALAMHAAEGEAPAA